MGRKKKKTEMRARPKDEKGRNQGDLAFFLHLWNGCSVTALILAMLSSLCAVSLTMNDKETGKMDKVTEIRESMDVPFGSWFCDGDTKKLVKLKNESRTHCVRSL